MLEDPLAAEFLNPIPEMGHLTLKVVEEWPTDPASHMSEKRHDAMEFLNECALTLLDGIETRADFAEQMIDNVFDKVLLAREYRVECFLAHDQIGGDLIDGNAQKSFLKKTVAYMDEDSLFWISIRTPCFG